MNKESKNYSGVLSTSIVRDRDNTLDLRVAVQQPDDGEVERWVVLCNGRTEWIEKYAHIPQDLKLSRSTGFLTWDHRGQGGSGGARAWIDDYGTYSRDFAQVIQSKTQGKPFNLICHSMGGLIALHAILNDYVKPRCLVLCSPLLGLPRRPFPPNVSYKVSCIMNALGMGHVVSGGGSHSKPSFADNVLTHSAERFEMIQNTPFPLSSATFGWVKASYEATQFIHDPAMLKKLNVPTLILSGTAEAVVDMSVVQPWVQLARTHAPAPIELHWIQEARHELLFESKPYYERTTAIIQEWFKKIGCPV